MSTFGCPQTDADCVVTRKYSLSAYKLYVTRVPTLMCHDYSCSTTVLLEDYEVYDR